MIRGVLLLLIMAVAVLLAATFAWLNPDSITLDLAFKQLTVRKSIAFAGALALGWVLGWLSTGGYILKLVRERRKLRRSARTQEAELESLRSLPASDDG